LEGFAAQEYSAPSVDIGGYVGDITYSNCDCR
jgi:hypothetical protein